MKLANGMSLAPATVVSCSICSPCTDTFGQIDYVFLNATGMQTGLDLQPLKKPDFGPAYSQIDSVLFGAHAATPYLASPNSTPVTEEGGEKPKRDRAIIITGSEGAFSGSDMSIFYSTGKGGLASYVMSSQHMFKDLGIRIGRKTSFSAPKLLCRTQIPHFL